MDYNDLNNDLNDELNATSSSSLPSNNNFGRGLVNEISHLQRDINAIKNRTGKNEQNIDQNKKNETKIESENKDSNKTSPLEKKDELSEKKNNEKTEDKISKDVKSTKKRNKIDNKIEAKEVKKLFSKLPFKIKLIAIAAAAFLAIFIFLYLLLVFNSFTNSISVSFGIKEAELKDDKRAPGQLFLYTDNDGTIKSEKDLTELTWPELVETLSDENVCNVGNALSEAIDFVYQIFTGGEFRDACQLIRFIRGTIESFEKKYSAYNLKMDTGLILGSIFFGYDQQATYSSYNDASNETFIPASNHFETLENIVKAKDGDGNAKLTKQEVLRIIKSTIFEEVYPNFIFSYSIEKNKKGEKIITGFCNQNNNQFYYNTLTKWEIFMRYNDDEQDVDDPKNSQEFGMSGYMRTKNGINKKVLNKLSDLNTSNTNNDEFLSLTGAGFVYDTNMNLSYESTDVPCNGSLNEGQFENFLMSICSDCVEAIADNTFVKAYNFYNDRNIKGIIDTKLYTQHIEDPDKPGKDNFKSVPRTYSIWSGNKANATLEPANARAEFNYLKGFAYRNFPGFEEADKDPNLPLFFKDEILSPKKIETIIEEIKERKEEFNEILFVDENGKPTRLFSGMYYVNANGELVLSPTESFYPKSLYYCEYIYDGKTTMSNSQLSSLQVNLQNCEGVNIGSTSFKDYIMGVTYGEIVISSAPDDLILTQMVASMSYALSRRSNETRISSGSITMKSGSCDQNWCDVRNGCVRVTGSSGYSSSVPGSGDRPALSESTINKLSNLYETASQYLLLDSNGNIFSAEYRSGTQEKWKELAKSGVGFVDILNQTYGDAIPIDCVIINENKDNFITDGVQIPQNIPPQTADQAVWAQMVLDKAMELYEKYNGDFRYISSSDAEKLGINPRVLAYNGQAHNGKFQIDCNAFISIVLNKALGIGQAHANSVADFQFVRPSSNKWIPVKDNIKEVASGLTLDQALALAKPGDILGSVGDGSSHVQIYMGNGVVIDNANANRDAPISLRTKDGHPDTGKVIRHQGGSFNILRVAELN